MLIEIENTVQYERGLRRRWFQDDFFDLYVWEDPQGGLQGFQLCYDKRDQQRALRWSSIFGYRHDGVDSPEDKPGRSPTEIFVVDGAFDTAGIGTRFETAALEMPPAVREFVMNHIRNYRFEL